MIRSVLVALPLLALGWLGVLALVALVSDAAPAYVVPWPSRDFVSDLPEDARIASYGHHAITLQSDTPGFARRLYGSGAVLVLPAGLPGCLPFSRDGVIGG